MKIPDGYVVIFHDNHGKDIDYEVKNLVLCKNCKHYEMASNEANGWCEENECPFVPWDFCSLGERKKE